MKSVLLVFLLVVGIVSHGIGKNVRLHGSLKEFGTKVVSMEFNGAAGEISKVWTQEIMVNEDGSFDFSRCAASSSIYFFVCSKSAFTLCPTSKNDPLCGDKRPFI